MSIFPRGKFDQKTGCCVYSPQVLNPIDILDVPDCVSVPRPSCCSGMIGLVKFNWDGVVLLILSCVQRFVVRE